MTCYPVQQMGGSCLGEKYVASFLVTQFNSLKALQKLLPRPTTPGTMQKSIIVPMKMLERDEKDISETIQILQDY